MASQEELCNGIHHKDEEKMPTQEHVMKKSQAGDEGSRSHVWFHEDNSDQWKTSLVV